MGTLKNFFNLIKPPESWKTPVIILIGIIIGLGSFLFYISKAYSYLSDNPKTCVNCHIMAPQYATWFHSSHREVASCNDCHVPHDNIFNTYYFKAKDGLRHATIFTLRAEPQVIFIKQAGHNVVQQNCVRCHTYLIQNNSVGKYTSNYNHFNIKRPCWDCHREVPHGRVNSLSSVPNAIVPVPESPVPEWLKKMIK